MIPSNYDNEMPDYEADRAKRGLSRRIGYVICILSLLAMAVFLIRGSYRPQIPPPVEQQLNDTVAGVSSGYYVPRRFGEPFDTTETGALKDSSSCPLGQQWYPEEEDCYETLVAGCATKAEYDTAIARFFRDNPCNGYYANPNLPVKPKQDTK